MIRITSAREQNHLLQKADQDIFAGNGKGAERMCQEKMSVDLIFAGEPERFSSNSAVEEGPPAVLQKPPELRMQVIEEMACAVAEMYKAMHAVDCA